MPQVFAGFICGYALALIATPSLGYALFKLRAESALLARLYPAGTSATAFAAVLHFGLIFACTALGILLGLILLAMDGAGGALGSPNIAFTLFVFGLVVAIMAPIFVLVRPMRVLLAANALVALVVFGWLMPYMARWAA